MKTAFDTLAEMHCKIVVSEKDPPFQWIYAVDDAWFHPAGWTLQINEGKGPKTAAPLFTHDWDTSEPVVIGEKAIEEPKENLVPIIPVESADPSGLDSLGTASKAIVSPQAEKLAALLKIVFNANHADAYTAKELIKFIQTQYASKLNYGLCFCTFEYFWKKIEDANQPQNAVFFDIRHALADGENTTNVAERQAELRDAWNKCLDGTKLFGREPLGNYPMTRLGWYLHYALKFGKFGTENGASCNVLHNHIQIISSAINPKKEEPRAGNSAPATPASSMAASGTGRGAGVMSEYTEVQIAIWGALQSANNEILRSITADRFTFSPIPKDEALKTGLDIFNNSFKNAASWEYKRKALLADMWLLWTRTDNGNWGHPNTNETRTSPSLSFSYWIAGNDEAYREDLCYGIHHLDTQTRAHHISLRTLLGFLKHALCVTVESNECCGDKRLNLGTNPGVSFLIGLADVYEALKSSKPGRTLPTVELDCDDAQVVVSLKIDAQGVVNLQKCVAGEKPGGTATTALQAALYGQGSLLCHLTTEQKQKSFQNGTTIETKLKDNKSKMNRICFCGDSIKFHLPFFTSPD